MSLCVLDNDVGQVLPFFVCNLGWDIKRCRHRSGRATGCNSVKPPFQYHGLLHRWSQYFRREPANVDPLDRSLELAATPSASSSHDADRPASKFSVSTSGRRSDAFFIFQRRPMSKVSNARNADDVAIFSVVE